jgi:RNA polymerase sigma-70 factor, ECF subfamily
MTDARAVAESVFRQQSGRIIATLIRISGSFDLAEEALQEAFTSAIARWPESGVPDNPAAWITTAAHRRLIDALRRDRTRREKEDPLRYETPTSYNPAELDAESAFDASSMNYPDDRLRLIFTCCHPAINTEAQVALTLRTLGGLTTPEIARAFLVPEATLAQRLVRAKSKIAQARIPYEVPPLHTLQERLQPVQAVLYLVFNEGYSATAGDTLIRKELCSEAIRLARLLCTLLPRDAETLGLLALMLLHDSRRNARTDPAGELILLEEQNRYCIAPAECRTVSTAGRHRSTPRTSGYLRTHRLAPDQCVVRRAVLAVAFSSDRAESRCGHRDVGRNRKGTSARR